MPRNRNRARKQSKAAKLSKKNRRKNKHDKAVVEKELELFQQKMKTVGCFVKGIKGDGNCLFRAVSDQIYGTEDLHTSLRAQSIEFMIIARDLMEAFVIGESYDDYVTRMAKEGVWAGHLELQALSMALQVNIIVHHLRTAPAVLNNFSGDSRTLHLSFHLGEHYNSVRPLTSLQGPAVLPFILQFEVPVTQSVYDFLRVTLDCNDDIYLQGIVLSHFGESCPTLEEVHQKLHLMKKSVAQAPLDKCACNQPNCLNCVLRISEALV
mmetsp:Transcript_946/g.2255  ORF Transcript_946/g.2255 Transcript_946/m.2255 type:complete len:266 (-) Transcript_946:1932-2729(-)